ncbi:MAG TPA: ABC transporter permease [Candidatus Polarisedimenticolia bacterium]|jgi:ABC-type antimicrobial peptide transport system permease subunit
MTLIESVIDGVVDIKAHKGRTLLQTVGVILGVASVVTVMALVDSGRRRMTEFFSEVGGLRKLLVVNRPLQDVTRTALQVSNVGLTYDDAMAMRSVPNIIYVDPIAPNRLLLTHGSFQEEWDVDGVTSDYPMVYKFHPARGRFISPDDLAATSRVCVLGDTTSRRIFGNDEPIGQTLFINGVGMTVVGVMTRKEYFFDDSGRNALEWMNEKIFVPITAMHKRFMGDEERKVGYINAIVDDDKNNQKATAEIHALLRRRHRGVEDFEVMDRSQRLAQQAQRNQMLNAVFLAAGATSLLVGGIVIMNILLASFQERVREVGVRKALGASGLQITAQFLVESVLVTFLGGGAGILLGFVFTQAVTSLINQPAVITPRMAVVGFVTSTAVGVFFGFYPAVKAARLDPVEALRYE